MAKISFIKWINRFLAAIKEKCSHEKVLLFGSRARGDNLIDSDVDMIIVSKKFEGVNWLKRIRDVPFIGTLLLQYHEHYYVPDH